MVVAVRGEHLLGLLAVLNVPADTGEEAGTPRTHDVERGEAGAVLALDAGAAAAVAQVAAQAPARLGDALHAVDRLHVHRVPHTRLRDPHGTEQVRPLALRRLLERAAFGRAEHAGDGAVGRHGTLAAEPLALGDVRDAVAVLVYGQVAPVAEDDSVRILTLAVVADGTERVLGERFLCVGRRAAFFRVLGGDLLHQRKPLFFQPVDGDLKRLAGDRVKLLPSPLGIERLEPLAVCAVSPHPASTPAYPARPCHTQPFGPAPPQSAPHAADTCAVTSGPPRRRTHTEPGAHRAPRRDAQAPAVPRRSRAGTTVGAAPPPRAPPPPWRLPRNRARRATRAARQSGHVTLGGVAPRDAP